MKLLINQHGKRKLTNNLFFRLKKYSLEVISIVIFIIILFIPSTNMIILSYNFEFQSGAAFSLESTKAQSQLKNYRVSIDSILKESASIFDQKINKINQKYNFDTKTTVKSKNNIHDRPILSFKTLLNKKDYSEKIRKSFFKDILNLKNELNEIFADRLFETNNLKFFVSSEEIFIFGFNDLKSMTGVEFGDEFNPQHSLLIIKNSNHEVIEYSKKNMYFFLLIFFYVLVFAVKELHYIFNFSQKNSS